VAGISLRQVDDFNHQTIAHGNSLRFDFSQSCAYSANKIELKLGRSRSAAGPARNGNRSQAIRPQIFRMSRALN
jgi:hypothetical protein